MQITETVLSEPVEIRRFIQQAVDHWPRLLAVHFTLHSAEGNINGQQIHAFCTSFYRQVHERITERNHTASPAPPVVLRWLREQHGGATMRCLLLLSQTSICHPRVSATVDEECSQRVDLLQQTWRVISADGQCRVERCFQAARGDTSSTVYCVKNSCIVSGVTGCDRYYPSPGTALYIDYSSVNSAVVQSTRFSVFSSVIQHH
ncbi:hypothetical protein O5623_24835 [Escherichia coli]|nr:hypothetical protein [Escherichia coli]